MATYETVNYRREGRIGYLTLNRPSSFNAVNDQLEADLMAAAQEFDLDDEAWIAILHGAGRYFCAGADVKQRFHRSREERLRKMTRGTSPEGYWGRTANWKPVIAAVHGYALGAGCSIAAECDLIVASEEAQFGITETKRGIPGARVWEVLKAPPLAVRAGVRALRWQWTKQVAEADLYDQALRLHLTEDFEESARSFVEKRQPVYRGR